MKGIELSSFFARAILVAAVLTTRADEPIRLHPDNPRYFLWRGQPAVLITAGEHYGTVMNLDFDYARYFEELKSNRFNLTRWVFRDWNRRIQPACAEHSRNGEIPGPTANSPKVDCHKRTGMWFVY